MRNNKLILLIVALLGMVVVATAELTSFQWFNSVAGNLKDNSSVDIGSNNATVLTYLSLDNTINFDADILLSLTYGNDFFYQALGNALPSRLVTSYMTEPDGGTDYAGYFTYAVVLDMPFATFTGTYGSDVTLVPVDTYYAITGAFGGLTDMDAAGPNPIPDSFNAGNLVTSSQVVPEPATALLFGIGGLGAWIVRRNKRKAQDEADA